MSCVNCRRVGVIAAVGGFIVCMLSGCGITDPSKNEGGGGGSTSACVPNCRSGFVCVSGQCVGECNPACSSGQKCVASDCVDSSTVVIYDYEDDSSDGSNFVSHGTKWDHTDLSYSMENFTTDLSTAEQVKAIRGALDKWTAACSSLSFLIASDATNSDIKFKWVVRDHGDGEPFDDGGTSGKGNILAHAFYPKTSHPGALHFDDYETWSSDGHAETINLGAVALHELGHTLGLEHSTDKTSIMYPYYSSSVTELRADDIAGIKAIYGCGMPSQNCVSTCANAGRKCGDYAGCNCGTCSGNDVCQANGQCAGSCSNTCSSGQQQCSGSTVQTCTLVNGCYQWQSGQTCSGSGQICQNGQCVNSCTNMCSSGQQQCSGNTVQACTFVNGCYQWQNTQLCNNGCQNGQCVNSCTNMCSSGQQQCSGNTVQACTFVNGCYQWQNTQFCNNGCQNGQCVNSCTYNKFITTGDYACGGGIVMSIKGTLDASGTLNISATKNDGTSFGAGDYYIDVFDPNDGIPGNHCKQFNVQKGHVSTAGGQFSLTFNSFPSLLTCGGPAKGYCVTKAAGGDNAWFCSNELYASYL